MFSPNSASILSLLNKRALDSKVFIPYSLISSNIFNNDFFRLYPRLVRWGFLALAVLPFVFLLLLFITRMKLAMLLGWIISIIAIDTYLIVVEYLRERYANYLGEEAMSAEEFRSAILHENLLFRPGMHYKPMHAVRTRLYEVAHGGSAG